MDGAALILGLQRRLSTTLDALVGARGARFHLLTRAAEELFALMATERALFDAAFEHADAGALAANQALLAEAHHQLLGVVQARAEEDFEARLRTLRRTLEAHVAQQERALVPALRSVRLGERSHGLAERIYALLGETPPDAALSDAPPSDASPPSSPTRRIQA